MFSYYQSMGYNISKKSNSIRIPYLNIEHVLGQFGVFITTKSQFGDQRLDALELRFLVFLKHLVGTILNTPQSSLT